MAYNPTKKYGYYIRGREVAILKFDTSDTETSYAWRTVNEAITDGIQIEYTKKPTVPTDESSTIDVGDVLAYAIISYLKAKLAERDGNIDVHEYYMKDFWRLVAVNESNKIVGARKVIPTGTEVLK